MKKTLSIILAILMIVTTIPMAFAADNVIEVDGQVFSDFDEALTYVNGLSTPTEVKLLSNIDASWSTHLNKYNEFYWPVNAEKIDLNGYELYFREEFYFVDGTFTVTDSSDKGEGKISANLMNIHTENADKTYLTLENGTLEGRALNYPTLKCYEDTVFTMTGGSVVDQNPSHCDTISDYYDVVINISGGTVESKPWQSVTPWALGLYFSVEHNITGGTFIGGIGCDEEVKLKDVIPDGYAIKDADGNYIDKNLFSIGNTVTVEKHNDHKFENCVCNICEYKCFHKDTFVQVEAKANTCTEIGWDAYEYCTACDYTTYKEIPAAHSIATADAKAPTCTEIGWDAYEYCTACDYTTYVEKGTLDHSLVLIKTTPAECGVPMVEFYNCEFCFAFEVAKPKFGTELFHSFTKYEVTEEAKCGVAGKEVAVCDNGCGETDEKAIEALTHTDADGDYICDNGCGHEFEKPEEPTEDTICNECGLPAHEETGVAMFICLLIGLFKLIYTFVTSI